MSDAFDRLAGDGSVRYSFKVAGNSYSIQFLRVTHLEGYDAEQLRYLRDAKVYDLSFRLDDCPTGQSGYELMGTGHAFQVLGGVANGILTWAHEHQPDYLHWYALELNRQRLYARMVGQFQARGSGYARMPCNPFTGGQDDSEFWVGRI